MSSSRLWMVGAFVLGGAVLFMAALFMIGDRRNLFGGNFEAVAEFRSVSGLRAGAPVRVAGFGAGEVVSIAIPAGPEQPFRVRMRLRDDLRQLVRVDSSAAIQTDGLIGNRIVQIDGGTSDAPVVGEGGLIRSTEPLDMEDIFQRASVTVDDLGAAVMSVRDEVEEALEAFTAFAQEATTVVSDVGGDLKVISGDLASVSGGARRVVQDVEVLAAGVREGRGTVGRLMHDDQLYQQVSAVAGDVGQTVANLRATTDQVRQMVDDVRVEGPDGGLTADLRRTMGQAEEAARGLADTTDALRHNVLVRGFFNRRGFFDLADMPERLYREGQLKTGGRTPLRLWIARDLLFEEVNGSLRLTEHGRARIDSAMSEVLKYPQQTPLMVEGYAPGATRDVQYRRSQEQASQVLSYIQGRYARSPTTTAAIALGPDPVGEPPGDATTWDGVAITMYVTFDTRGGR
jgi:phospholipid/cholesterol/gamma-HCH transport system substrate-binding protein